MPFRWVLLEQLSQDLRYAARAMQRTPGFALVATLCLAIGIGVNTAAFSVLNAVMFRDYPGVTRQGELVSVQIGWQSRWGRSTSENVSLTDWALLRTGIPAFSDVAAVSILQLSVRVSGEPQAVRGALVSNNYFEVLGTRPAIGRFMTAADDRSAAEPGVVISRACWQRRFAARPDILGQVVTVGKRAYQVIGVAPEGFFGLSPGEVVDPDVGAAEFFVPMAEAPYLRTGMPAAAAPGDRWLQVFGRLNRGATVAEAEAQAGAVAAQLAAAYPVERRNAFAVVHAAGDRAKDAGEAISAMLLVMVVPAIILLVACANLANQLLARAIQRGREIAVRLSLGATRARVVRQLLAETALLAVVASGLGVVLARWMLDGLRAWVLEIPFRVPIDARVLLFTVALALATALAFGLVPALRATQTDLATAMKDGMSGGYRRSRLRQALVVAQIAASLALTAVSTVFVRAGQRPASPALDALAGRSLLVSVNLDLLGFDSLSGRAWQRSVLERVGQLPGVAAVGLAPFAMFDMLGGERMTVPGGAADQVEYNDLGEISGGWFNATNTRPLRGRLFTAAELAGRPTVAVVDEVLAHEMWGNREAIGQSLRLGEDSVATLVTVVGVVPTRQEVSFRQPEGVAFIPGNRRYEPRTVVYVRTSGDAAAMLATVRQAVRSVDPRVPILWARTLEEAGAKEVASLTMLASALAGLGAVALALAALGLFGVLAFIVAQRRYEIGIRMALGARRSNVTWMVLRQALGLGVGGVVVAALIAVATVALLRSIIHGLEPLDLPAFAAMSATMVAVALLASAVPARRAASVDPMTALRAE